MPKYTSTIIACAFALLAVIAKWKWLPFEANFAVFGGLSIFCGAYLRGWAAWVVPVGALAVSDLFGEWFQIPGVHRYDGRTMLFNYAGFATMIALGHCVRLRDRWEVVLGATLLGSLTFFVVSNFGAWLDPLMKYDRSWTGLLDCYAMAIPFFRPTLVSDLIFVVAMTAVHRAACQWSVAAETEPGSSTR